MSPHIYTTEKEVMNNKIEITKSAIEKEKLFEQATVSNKK